MEFLCTVKIIKIYYEKSQAKGHNYIISTYIGCENPNMMNIYTKYQHYMTMKDLSPIATSNDFSIFYPYKCVCVVYFPIKYHHFQLTWLAAHHKSSNKINGNLPFLVLLFSSLFVWYVRGRLKDGFCVISAELTMNIIW